MKRSSTNRGDLRQARRESLRALRILALLIVLFLVALGSWREHVRSTQWRVPLFVAVYPIAADASPVTRGYIGRLDAQRFTDIDRFFAAQAHAHGVQIEVPLKPRLQPPLDALPPVREPGAGALATMWWSLKLRFWAWRQTRGAHEPADVRMFVLYHDPADNESVPHSAGLLKGMIGVVHAFARTDMDGGNSMVIAHEIMHTLGATDKYDPNSDAPQFPHGYGDPRQMPLYPQRSAELMGGRLALSATQWEQPDGLDQCVVGELTAREIRWSEHAP